MILKRKGFTVIELVVAAAVLAILSTVITVNLLNASKTSRNGKRKTDVQALLGAVNQYVLANGSTLIVAKNASGVLGTCTLPPIPDQNNISNLPSGTGDCTGAAGRSYGKVNVKSSATITATSDAYTPITTIGRTYAQSSIVDALYSEGYLSSIPRDPSSNSQSVNDPNLRDYVLIRACTTGYQYVGQRGSLFGVWTSLEGIPTASDSAASNKFVGGNNVIPATSSGNYLYDFAAQTAEYTSGAYSTYGYAVGNGTAKTVAFNDSCTGPSTTSPNS